MNPKNAFSLRWIGANALGEMLGLGATLGSGFLIITALGEAGGFLISLLSSVLMVLSGAIEGAIVGWLQWRAMAPFFPQITRRAWLGATIGGALAAWFFGSLPFSLMDMNAQATGSQPVEPAQWIVLLAASGVGLVAGGVLAFFQWRTLRQVTRQARWWIPANMLAWAAGMPLIFWGIDWIQKGMSPLQAGLSLALTLLFTGAIVGTIHGMFLARWITLSASEG
jgi:hypothetical protein